MEDLNDRDWMHYCYVSCNIF